MSVKVTRVDNLAEALEQLYARGQGVIKPGLARTEQLLDALGRPERRYPSVHITGTNGKGSTAAMLESILRGAGYRTALYTQPHLHHLNERFQVSGRSIPNERLADLISRLETLCQEHAIPATFHEFTTALAFAYFAEEQVDVAIIEACMGGRWDATNVITPNVSVITNVGLDHTKWLGPTKQHIAREKAGIIKPGVPLVTTERDPVLQQYFANVCREQRAPCRVVEPHSAVRALPLGLAGDHQYSNAAAALATIELLATTGLTVSTKQQEAGLAATQWPGRVQVVSQRPTVIVDAAHNRESVEALVAYLDEHLAQRDVLVLGMKEDKDVTPWTELVVPSFRQIIVTEGAFLPAPAERVAAQLRSHHADVTVIPDARRATAEGLRLAGPDGSLLVAGSLYMIPEALAYLEEHMHTDEAL